MDELEKFIRIHQEDLNDKVPKDENWKRIQENLEVKKKEKKRKLDYNNLWKAASITLFCICAYLLLERKDSTTTIGGKEIVSENKAVQELKKTEAYYVQLISSREKEVGRYSIQDKQLVMNFQKDIEILDNRYLQLKEELQEEKTRKVIDAMVQNMQLRLEILNQQLQILENVQNEKTNESNDKGKLI
ncbi:hypothetical protein [Xanthovirga aplysinae]|uniref:hypothetical protein n=1 Tax=Xanthovirga aplysinae TaxID=2529853 RepID=UPI0012BD3A43|nr:hypothetical protein [Xanthovirga aplysinae]MTI30436.1 hypothetical protein [Xanthovirga aplysinae]